MIKPISITALSLLSPSTTTTATTTCNLVK